MSNYTPIETQSSESFIHKAFTYNLLRNRYVQIVILVGVLVYAIIATKDYFSQESTCRREVKKKVELAAKLTSIQDPYLIKNLIAEESKKCTNK